MAVVRRRRRASRIWVLPVGVLILALAGGTTWYFWPRNRTKPAVESAPPLPPSVAPVKTVQKPAAAPAKAASKQETVRLAADEQIVLPSGPTSTNPTSQPTSAVAIQVGFRSGAGDDPDPRQSPGAEEPTTRRFANETHSGNRDIEAARRLIETGKLVEARHGLNALLARPLGEAEQSEVRALLTRLADETLFSQRILPDDPLVETYTVQSGDRLINIGRQFNLPHEIIMKINGISDATRIRAGQTLKVLRGPFHVKIYKSKFRLDVYLGDLYVRSFRVGLGTGGGTPEGVWRVKERLPNPTYYPPASAPDKRIIPADDPNNPLGEHWIGLEGVEGDAKGREGYGIHGTIEPESIGKAVSLGCIRMYNEDVAFLYQLMLPGRSTVTVLP